jgi:hypothetical protein
MVHVRVRDEHMVDLCQLGDGQVSDTGTGVNQDVVVDENRRRSQMTSADASTAAQNTDLHHALLSLTRNTPGHSMSFSPL